MKKVMLTVAAALAVTVVALYVFREPLMEQVAKRLTEDMFIAADVDDFDPGVVVGERLPELRAAHQGETVTDLQPFAGPNGLVLIANRSVDW
jgi:hypothetical protein